MEAGDIIKNLRMQKGLTQEELGNILGVKKAAVQKYESGRVENIKRSTIAKMAEYFNVSPSFIMGLEELEKKSVENEEMLSSNDESISKDVLDLAKRIQSLNPDIRATLDHLIDLYEADPSKKR